MNGEAFEVRVGQFGVVKMSNGELQAFEIVEIFEPNVESTFLGHTFDVRPYQCVHLQGCAVVDTRSLERVIDTENEAKLFMLEASVERTLRDLQIEREAHAATKQQLHTIRRALRSL
jgi:hypothetical protein